ncbi:MAG: MATE family efflux transporter [Muribaculum sp.]|nr:MATE family efflux transporter [Muribaculum sp.]
MAELDNKMVVKNATALTIRMIIVTIVGLYTSRVVFSQLGDVNYGIYGVVGSILGFMSFLTASMAGATTRFITYEIGVGNKDRISEIFNASFFIHCGIAIIVILVGETFGVWFLNHVLVIPSDRLNAAWWVFQFSIISSAITITQVPYTAVLMAYEKMNVYAYFEIVNVVLKLLIVYLLSIAPFDKLIVYAFLLLIVSTGMAFSYRWYCIRNFRICKLKKVQDSSTFKSMLSFSGMDLYGNICVTLNSQGLTYAINIFFGVVYNAAVSLATTVNGMLLSLTTNIAIAFKPQIIKQYSTGNIVLMEEVMKNSMKFTLVSISILAIPCALEAEFVLKLWLGEVPLYTVEFLRIIILQSFMPVVNNVCNAAIHATGNIKALTYINGTIFLLLPACIFVLFYLGANVLWAYGIEIIGMIVVVISAICIIKNLIPSFNVRQFIIGIIRPFSIIIISTIPTFLIHFSLREGFLRAIIVSFSYFVIVTILAWNFMLNKNNQQLVKIKINAILSPFKKSFLNK